MYSKQILEATGEELSRLAGEVLCPEGGEHTPLNILLSYYECIVCGTEWDQASVISMDSHAETKCLPHVPLTWPEAMKWRDWITCKIPNFVADEVFIEIAQAENSCFKLTGELKIAEWWVWNAQPEHYIKAACLCKLEGETK